MDIEKKELLVKENFKLIQEIINSTTTKRPEIKNIEFGYSKGNWEYNKIKKNKTFSYTINYNPSSNLEELMIENQSLKEDLEKIN